MKRRRMQRKKPDPEAAGTAPPPVSLAPFHAPFRELAGRVRVPVTTGLRKTAPAGRAAPGSPAALPERTPPRSPGSVSGPSREDAPAVSDAEALAAELAGVAPLPKGAPRVRLRRPVDLSHIEAKRREDLDALARAEGFDVTYEDRYVRGRASGVSFETLARLEKGEFRICAHLDLHGMPLDDARRAVDEFLALQQKRGHRCVLLVTGKGKNSPRGHSVLREQVPQWLARGPSARRVLAFASARPCDGGLGALVVLMRGSSSSKHRIDVEHGGSGPLRT